MGRRVNQSMYYNRQSKGFQQNQMKKQMADAGYAKGMPTPIDPKKLRKGLIISLIAWAVLTAAMIYFLHWTGLWIGLGIALVGTGGVVLYMRNKEKEVIRAYKRIGMPKKDYMNFLKKNSKTPMSQKTLDKLSKTWDKLN